MGRLRSILEPYISDHSPVIMGVKENEEGDRPFKFLNFMVDHPMFLDFIKEVWREDCTGHGLRLVCNKLKKVEKELKHLHSVEYKGVSQKVSYWQGGFRGGSK